MTREQIEKAALICAGAGEYGELPYNPDAKKGFIAGAQWRINSVWQDATKFKPRHGSKVAVLVGGKDITVWNFENGMEQAFSCMSIKCWAYLDDLIPDRKED